MCLSLDTFLLKEGLENAGVGGGYLLAVEPFQALIINGLGDGKREAAAAESKTLDDIGLLCALYKLILTYNAYISYTAGNRLRLSSSRRNRTSTGKFPA